VEPGAAQRRTELEVRLERREDLPERMEVLTMLLDELIGGLRLRLAERFALLEPPGRGADVECCDIELVDDERPARLDELSEPAARIRERVDVVERDDRDRGGEGARGLVEIDESDRPDVLGLRFWVDRDDVVAGGAERTRESPVAGAHLEHARGRLRQVRAGEGSELDRCHVAGSLPGRRHREYVLVVTAQPATEYRNLLVTVDGPSARVVLNRPEKRNALSLELMEEMISALSDVSAREGVRAVVIEGAGPAFSAGHDLSEMIDRDRVFFDRLFDVCTVMMQTIHELPQPVIAKVHGIATAAGCQLVAACDLAVAAEGARFATPGVKIGLFCSTPMVPVSRAVGRKRALQMLLTGEPIDAATALAWGLVNDVVPADELETAVQALVEAIARSSAYTVATGKGAFYSQVDRPEDEAYRHCAPVMAENALAHDAQEGMSAFLEKRAPVWRGE
jgi:enoyl-CoA hydratase/carnithine racemase